MTDPHFGPRLNVDASCYGCGHKRSVSYRCQGDSGHDIYCDHPEADGRPVGDTCWTTPDWCPLGAQMHALRAALSEPVQEMREGEAAMWPKLDREPLRVMLERIDSGIFNPAFEYDSRGVEELRKVVLALPSEDGWRETMERDFTVLQKDYNRAAIIIDRLRAALEKIRDLGSDGEHSGDRHARCREIAGEALS